MSIRHSALKGASYASVAVVASRGMSFVSQLIIGWLLAKDDFAIYALAVGVMSFTNAMVHGGANILMFQGADRIDRVLPAGMKLATIFDIGIPIIIASLAWPIAQGYDTPELATILWIIAASFPLRLLGLPYRMRAAAEGRFGDVSFSDICQSLIQQTLLIVFALCGFGAFSFVLGLPIVNIIDWLILRKRLGPAVPSVDPPDPLKTLLKPAGMVLITSLGIALAVGTSENLILGKLASPMILAYYFFGFRLTSAISQVFGGSIRSVLIPSFAKIKNEPQRMQTAAIKASQTLFFLTIPLFYTLAFMVGPIMHFLWQGNWDNSAIVAFALILAVPNRLGLFLNRSFLEANGRWGTTAVLVWVDGLLLATAVILSATSNDLTTIAFSIAGYRAMGGLILSIIALKLGGVGFAKIMPLLKVPVIGYLSLAVSWYFSGGEPQSNIQVTNALLSIGIFLGCYLLLGTCFLKTQFKQTRSALSLRKKK